MSKYALMRAVIGNSAMLVSISGEKNCAHPVSDSFQAGSSLAGRPSFVEAVQCLCHFPWLDLSQADHPGGFRSLSACERRIHCSKNAMLPHKCQKVRIWQPWVSPDLIARNRDTAAYREIFFQLLNAKIRYTHSVYAHLLMDRSFWRVIFT